MNKEIVFVFKKGRKINQSPQNITSSEFFYGLITILKKKYQASSVLEDSFGIGNNSNFLIKIINWISVKCISFSIYPIFYFIFRNKSKDHKKVYVLTTNTQGFIFSLAKQLNLIKSDIYFIIMGAIPSNISKFKLIFYKLIFMNTNLIFQSNNELKYINKILPDHKKFFVPFGVNHRFWKPDNNIKHEEEYILTIGNDLSRDHNFLIDCWKTSYPKLIIITSHKLTNTKSNIEIISGDWKNKILSDEEIRDFYRKSKFVIITLKPNIDASGQSVALQALSCEKTVLITKTIGFWDDKHFNNNENIIFVKPNKKSELQSKIEILINNYILKKRLEKNGRKLVINNFTEEIMGKEIYKVINENSN
jgi:glycosyltransferase involved in cell wall biosynthesis